MMKRFLLCLLLLGSTQWLSAQKITQFSADSLKFIKELDAYFQENAANKKEAEDYVKKFEKIWKTPELKAMYRQAIYKTSNMMLQRRLKPYPYFVTYINSVVNFMQSPQTTDKRFEAWQGCLEKIFNSKNIKVFGDFLEMSENLFVNNTFYKSPNYAFRSENTNYTFEYDTTARVIFPSFTLMGTNPRGDSIAIENTKGIYYPSTGKLYGTGGRVSWKRVGLDDGVYADLKRYVIDCNTGGYTADSVTFYGKQYFDKPQMGRLSDKIVSEHGEPSYPRFDSYSKRLVVKNLYPDVDYDGGFGMRADKFVGAGDAKNPARIIFKRNGQRFLEVSARAFGITKEKLNAKPAFVKFFIDKDSIIHPQLSFVYQVEQKLVTLLRGDDGLERSPYYDSYHKVDMYFERLLWKTDEPKIEMGFLPNNLQGEAFFESSDFYNRARMDEVRGAEQINPVLKMNDFYLANGSKMTFSVIDFAKYIKYLAVDLRPIIFRMANYGLIMYDPENDMVTIKPRLFDYIKNNRHERDYDIITIHSALQGKENATLNLLNNDMTIRGVKQILLSDTQKVFMFPQNRQLVLKKDRNIEFSGVVASGKFEFHGKDFLFDYEMFKIRMHTVDSVRIYVQSTEQDEHGEYPYKMVKSVIENPNGELRIDAPRNKSGWGKAPTFPIFQSFKESYVFYDDKQIFRGVYKRDQFYFKIDPFTIDSLDNFRNERLIFDGEFSSAGIFPVFREKLTLQKDYSLGFIRNTPPGGYPAYGGKGTFENQIRLSNKGLRAGGDLNYVTATLKSDDFIFYPDSMNTIAQSFDIKEQIAPVEYPQAHGDTVRVHWTPYKDMMNVFNKKTPFKSYNTQATFKGRYDLSPKELRGKGTVDFGKADLVSKDILFKQHQFFADTGNFHLRAMDEEGLSFATDNVNAKIDFEKRTGDFTSNGKGTTVRFPKNQFIAFMDRFKWYMDNDNIQLGDETKKMDQNVENALDLEGPEFISVHPKQDSLRFFAPAAVYDLKKFVITAINVPFVNVADARVFPDSGKIVIRRDANVDTLKNATILANTVTKYHTIRNVSAKLMSSKYYQASGEYQYLDENNQPYLIKFSSIRPDTTGQTISEGDISEAANFKFNDYFSFAGKVKLFAANQFLTFVGGTRIVHNCNNLGKSYLQFSGEINPKEILIPLPPEPKDMNGNKIASGILYSPDTNMVYSAFISPRGGRADKDVLLASGFLSFDRASNEYRISSKEKLVEQSLPGNYLSLNTTNCLVYGEGKLDIGADLGQVKTEMLGNVVHNTLRDSATFEMMMTIDFFFDNDLMKKMFKDMEVYLNTLTPFDFSNKIYTKGLTELLGKEKADKTISDLNLYGSYKKFPDELKKTFVIGYTQMRYDQRSRSFLSNGSIGVCNINKDEFFRYVPGKIQIKRQKNGDVLTMYFEFDPNTWYFFTYFKGVMKVISSNQEFNNAIRDMKSSNRKQSVEKGVPFQYTLGSPSLRTQFLNKMKQTGNAEEE